MPYKVSNLRRSFARLYTCGAKTRCCLWTENPTPYFSFCLSNTGSQDPNFRVTPHPVFRGAGGDPALQHAALLRPVREQWAGRGGDFSFWSDLIFSPTELFLVFYAPDRYRSSEVGVLVLSRPQIFLPLRCASVAMDWFQCVFFFFSPTSASTKLRKQSL